MRTLAIIIGIATAGFWHPLVWWLGLGYLAWWLAAGDASEAYP